jgi:hypothetical protein
MAASPTVIPGVRANRRFLGRVVRHMAAAGIWQFLQPITFRSQAEVARFFDGLELVEPGVVPVQEWHPDEMLDFNSAPTAMWGALGTKN